MSGVAATLIPPVQQLGDAVLFRGQGVRDLAYLLPRAVEAAARRDGISPPRRWLEALAAIDAAVSACPVSDVQPQAESAQWLTTKQAAQLLGLDERQVRRLGGRLGGRRARGGWVFDQTEVARAAAERKVS